MLTKLEIKQQKQDKYANMLKTYVVATHVVYCATDYWFGYTTIATLGMISLLLLSTGFYVLRFSDLMRATMITAVIISFFTFLSWNYNHFFFIYLLVIPMVTITITDKKKNVYISGFMCFLALLCMSVNLYYDFNIFNDTISETFKLIIIYETIILVFCFITLNLNYIMDINKINAEIELEENTWKETSDKSHVVANMLFDRDIKLYEDILYYFEKNGPWKDINFNQVKLAEALNTNTYYISKALNQVAEKSFNNFVNDYRVKQIIQAFENYEHKKYTLKHIYTEAGFSNQSTFNRAFKKEKGVSPKEYLSNLSGVGV